MFKILQMLSTLEKSNNLNSRSKLMKCCIEFKTLKKKTKLNENK